MSALARGAGLPDHLPPHLPIHLAQCLRNDQLRSNGCIRCRHAQRQPFPDTCRLRQRCAAHEPPPRHARDALVSSSRKSEQGAVITWLICGIAAWQEPTDAREDAAAQTAVVQARSANVSFATMTTKRTNARLTRRRADL